MKETTIVIGSTNPGKIEGLKLAFEKYEEFGKVNVIGIKADSEVPDQPINTQTFLGAKNRVKNLKKYVKENGIKADYFASVESGIVNFLGVWQVVNIAIIEDSSGNNGYGQSAGFPVPNKIAEIAEKSDLTKAMDIAFENDASHGEARRQGKGGIGLLTDDRITRIDLNTQAFIMALIPLRKKCWQEN